MQTTPFFARSGATDLGIVPSVANRHGCIFGATGTGKTVTLQRLAECFSEMGVPVFLADIKGDLSGIADVGSPGERVSARLGQLGLTPQWRSYPVTFWDVFGASGHPVRATVSDMGPQLLARLLGLNETQAGVLTLVFKVADDHGLLLLDLKDLRSMLQWCGEHAGELKTKYGNVSAASVGAIQRGLIGLEEQGGDVFFGEPMLDIDDLMQTRDGLGVVNILAADRLIHAPKLYASLLLWLLAELFERLPEVGDLAKPKLAFFFDEAHLLFDDAPPALLETIERVVRLIRSKGVGVYLVSQNPSDIPDKVLGQLGNRVQHALRAFTPRDQRAVKAVADSMRPNPAIAIERAVGELAVGEALISLLDADGVPGVTQRALVVPPSSKIGPIAADRRAAVMASSDLKGVYDQAVDRESAYEQLSARAQAAVVERQAPPTGGGALNDLIFGSTGPRGGKRDGLIDVVAKSAARSVGSSLARELTRGLLGSLLGGKRRR